MRKKSHLCKKVIVIFVTKSLDKYGEKDIIYVSDSIFTQ